MSKYKKTRKEELAWFLATRKFVFRRDNKGQEVLQLIATSQAAKAKLLAANEKIAKLDGIPQQVKDFIISQFRGLVMLLDYMLAYVILSYYSEFIPFLPVWLKALVTIVCITSIEIIISLFEKEKIAPTTSTKPLESFEFDEQLEEEYEQYELNEERNRKARLVRHMFIAVLPLVSLATMSQEIAAEMMNKGLVADIEAAAHDANIIFIVLKYVALALCSYGSHYFLTEYSDVIVAAQARIKLRKECKKLDKTIAALHREVNEIDADIEDALMDYHDRLKMHVGRFGKHEMLPSESFTPRLDKLYLKVNGGTVL